MCYWSYASVKGKREIDHMSKISNLERVELKKGRSLARQDTTTLCFEVGVNQFLSHSAVIVMKLMHLLPL